MVDVPRLREACARAGARLVVDATQAAGILKVDSQRWKADAVVTSGYKWLGGHGGVALSAVSPSLLEQDPPLPGWFGTNSPFDFEATSLHFAADARRFTQSTMSYISMAGLTTALDHLMSLRESRLEAHSRHLSRQTHPGCARTRMDTISSVGGRIGFTPHSVARPLGIRRGESNRRIASQPYRLWSSQRSHQDFARALQQQC